ncbi:MAG: hypothetical protein WC840_03100 [Candidatus Peribacteraceae bacterium]
MVVLLLGRGIVLQLMGYPVDIPPTELADEIAAENGDPLRCRRLQQTVPTMGPSLTEKRMLCFFLLAQEKRDPKICEYLIPGEYGLSCINNVVAQEYKDHSDAGFFEFSECMTIQKDPLRQDWCQFVRAHRSRKTSDCAGIKNDVIRSGCILKFEAWEKYPGIRGSFYFGQSLSP